MENCDGEPVRATSANLEAVLNALRQAGVEVDDETLDGCLSSEMKP
jgi:hypothetical protein